MGVFFEIEENQPPHALRTSHAGIAVVVHGERHVAGPGLDPLADRAMRCTIHAPVSRRGRTRQLIPESDAERRLGFTV